MGDMWCRQRTCIHVQQTCITEYIVLNNGDMMMLHLLPLRIILPRASFFSRIVDTRYDFVGIAFKPAKCRACADRCAFFVFLPRRARRFLHTPPDLFFFAGILLDWARDIVSLRFFSARAKDTRRLTLFFVLKSDLQQRCFEKFLASVCCCSFEPRCVGVKKVAMLTVDAMYF